jgi:hypothetical protein
LKISTMKIHTRHAAWLGFVAITIVGFSALRAAPIAQNEDLALTAADVDTAASYSIAAGKKQAANADLLLEVMGLLPVDRDVAWSAGEPRDWKESVFQYVVVFKKPVAIGTLFAFGGGQQVSYLKAGASATADPADAKAWLPLDVPGHQTGATVVPFPKETTQALLFTDRLNNGPSELRVLRLFKARLQNMTPAAEAYASHEYYRKPADFTPPFLWAATRVTSGQGDWQSAGENKGRIEAAPISDVLPEWFVLSWPKPQTISGLWVHGSIRRYSLEYFTGDDSVNPNVGLATEWKTVKNATETMRHGRWIGFDKPITTRGLRINITKTDGKPQVAIIDGLAVLRDLGDAPAEKIAFSTGDPTPPPFKVPFDLKEEGNLTFVVNDSTGKRVRNVIGREPTKAGPGAANWDLRDESGVLVASGEYTWTALAAPQFQPKYEFTVYPNVPENAPENTAWFNGSSGSGGWLADHCNNSAVCAIGDRLFLAAYMAESGVALIECDLQGHKKWGLQGFAAWTGVGHLASDGKTLFNITQLDGNDHVWGVDLETKQVRDILTLPPTASRKRGNQGIATRDGKLYLSQSAPENWLDNAMAADDVDITRCVPILAPWRKPKGGGLPNANVQTDFLRLFRLMGTPPGTCAPGAWNFLQTSTDSAKRQHIVISFVRPVPVGSVVLPLPEGKDIKMRISFLKADAPYPPRPDQKQDWTELEKQPKTPWDVVDAPAGTMTRALRLSFTHGDDAGSDDILGSLDAPTKPALDKVDAQSDDAAKQLAGDAAAGRWQAKLEGVKILRRRFRNLSVDAEVRVSSGEVNAIGEWDAKREKSLTASDPGVYVQQWKQPQKVRGLAIKEIDGRFTKIDVYTGPATGAIDINSKEGWKEVATYEQTRRNFYYPSDAQDHDSRYVDGYVDFGSEIETRAVRLRIVEQWADGGYQNLMGVRQDRGGQTIDPKRCRVYGVAAMQYIGGEPAIDSRSEQRIEVFDSVSGKLEREVAIKNPGRIVHNPAGELLAVSGNTVVKVDLEHEKHQLLVSDLVQPGALAVDAKGQVYVYDQAPERQNVRVFSADGKFLRAIGKPGGGRNSAGPWDPQKMTRVIDINVDKTDQLWVVEDQFYPKRVALWGTDGTYKKEFLGNTPYGGGGVLDPYDKSRVFVGPLEFSLDWKTGHSYLKNLTWVGPDAPGEVPIQYKDRTYLVTRGTLNSANVAIVYLYEKDHLKLAAAMGQCIAFDAMKNPDLIAKLGGPSLKDNKFIWADRNGNGEVDADEITLAPKPVNMKGFTNFNRDLSAQSGAVTYVVKEVLANGAPVYEEMQRPESIDGHYVTRLYNNNFFRVGTDGLPEAGVTAEGKQFWTWPSFGAGGHAMYKPDHWERSQVVAEFSVIGHEVAPEGDLGEFVVLHGNSGAWNVWSADGLLVGPIFTDYRNPISKPWSGPEHARGTILTDISQGQEHFQGYFCQSLTDKKFYAVAGHNHVSVVEILGLDKVKRYGGKITVTPGDLKKVQAWQEKQQVVNNYKRSPVLDVYRLEKPPQIDGRLEDWQTTAAQIPGVARFHMGFDENYLYLGFAVENNGPLKNTGDQWDRLFKSGAAVDLHIGTDPDAPADRGGPVLGDIRVLMTYMGDKPAAVLYRSVTKVKPKTEWKIVSPVFSVSFDEVRKIDDVVMARYGDDQGYSVEAAIPLKQIELSPTDGMRLKMDWGFLKTGPDGHEVLQRVYWANQATGIVADAPSEAMLHPELWGFARFHTTQTSGTAADHLKEDLTGPTGGKKPKIDKKDVDDILDSIKDDKKK